MTQLPGPFYPGAYVSDATPALISADSGASISYSSLDTAANRLARGLRFLGLEPGDHLSICMENRVDYPILWWGAHYAGLQYTLISTALTSREVAHIVRDSGAKVLILSPTTANRLAAELRTEIPALELLVVGGQHAGATPLERIVARLSMAPLRDAHEGSAMLYSSGTTGVAKGIKRPLSGQPLGTNAPLAILAQYLFDMGPGSVYLSPAPLYHAAPYGYVTAATQLGATAVIMDRFDAELALAAIERHRVTHAQFVPTMFIRMLRLPPEVRERYDVTSLQCVLHAGAPCPVPIKEQMFEWWGPVIHEYYGGTEGAGICYCSPTDWLSHKGSVGRSLLGEIHITDDEGAEVPVGTEGVVYFGGGLPFEYHNDPAKTQDARRGDWATYGDIGRLDEDGFLYLTDRRAYVIITGGVNVYPQEAENLLASHPAVADVAVIGIPNEVFGEEVKAVLQVSPGLKPGPDLEAELIAYCRANLAEVKCPRSIDFREVLPRDDTGKLKKRLLRDEYWQGQRIPP